MLIGAMHLAGLYLYLYWVWWYDIVMHFLGGAWVALASAWLLFYSGFFQRRPVTSKNIFLVTFSSVLVIGVGWEVFEYIFDIAVVGENYVSDTTMDFIMDFIGAGVVAVIVKYRSFL